MPLAEFPLEDAGNAKIVVDVDPPGPKAGAELVRSEEGLIRAEQTFDAALASIQSMSMRILDTLKELALDQGEVRMRFRMTAESGVVLAKVDGDAHIDVKLVWKK